MQSRHGTPLSERIIGSAIEVHRRLGPGLLESIYEECLCYELRYNNIAYARQVGVPVLYRGMRLACTHRIDILVEDEVVLEIKAVERVMPIHEAQLLTYLRLGGYEVGCLMNFNSVLLKQGLRRYVQSEFGSAHSASLR